MKELILEILKHSDKALSVHEIEEKLKFNTVEELKELIKTLNEMEDNLEITRTKKNNYMSFNNDNLVIGTISTNRRGYGFVEVLGKKDIFIDKKNLKDAIHGDKVVVEYISHEKDEGKITRIISRNLKQAVGEFYYKKRKAHIILDDNRLNINIIIQNNKTMGAIDGHKVLVKLLDKVNNDTYNGEVIKIIGHKNDPGVDIESIAASMGIIKDFKEETMLELEKIPYYLSDKDIEERLKIGKDLREEIIFTIDGDDTKDIDDAISINKKENGNFILGVHIADVSHYVKIGSSVDSEAYDRGTSYYLVYSVIPMLHQLLSNGICSLNEGEDRLSFSCVMEIDTNGKVIDNNIFLSLINSKKKMTYKNVNSVLEENIIPEGYENFEMKLKEMYELSKILRKEKVDRGYIEFDIDEAKIITNEKGEAIDVLKRYRGIAENIIEDFMIAANETVATTIFFMGLPFVYRVHGEPDSEKIENFKKILRVLGYKVEKTDNITPKLMQKILNDIKSKKEFSVLSSLLLRSMQKAVYDTNNIGHFGLASKCYTHFTSPIRRYPDLMVHRLLKKYLIENDYSMETINYLEQSLPEKTFHCSKQERLAIECEREVESMKKSEYMLNHIGEEYDGIITGVANFGMFVGLDNLVEGLIRIDKLDGYYTYDEDTFSLIRNDKKMRYRLGDNVRIVVVAASKETKTIDFEIAKIKKDTHDKVKVIK